MPSNNVEPSSGVARIASTPDETKRRAVFIIVAVALAIRLPIGYVTFGSVDLKNAIAAADLAIHGELARHYHIPYFPLVPALLWCSTVLQRTTALPPAFCYKLWPLIFDCATAVLIYKILIGKDCRYAWHAGVFYALCPIGVIINMIQVQWDSIAIFLLLGAIYASETTSLCWKSGLSIGFLLALSVLVKPYTVVFAPFLLPPCYDWARSKFVIDRTYIAKVSPLAVGGIVTFTVALAIFHIAGFGELDLFKRVLHYAASGVQIFGLPFAAAPLRIFQFRIVQIPTTAILLMFFLKGNINRYFVVLFIFLVTLGSTGLAPQYLSWPVAFMLIERRVVWLAAYTLLATPVIVTYFLDPGVSYIPGENDMAFATLQSVAWAMPPGWLTEPTVTPVFKFVANVVLPIFFLGMSVVLIKDVIATRSLVPVMRPPRPTLTILNNEYTWFVVLITLMVAGIYTLVKIQLIVVDVGSHTLQSAVTRYAIAGSSAQYGLGSPMNVPLLMFVLAVASAIWLMWGSGRRSMRGEG